jgi:hypothetical protein
VENLQGTVAKNIARAMNSAAQLQDETVKVYNWREIGRNLKS